MAAIGVFCGSSEGSDPRFAAAASELGNAIAVAGHHAVDVDLINPIHRSVAHRVTDISSAVVASGPGAGYTSKW